MLHLLSEFRLRVVANQGKNVAIQSVKAITVNQLARGALTVARRHPVSLALSAAGLLFVDLDNGSEFQRQSGLGSESLDCSDGCYKSSQSGVNFYSENASTAAKAALSYRGLVFTRCDDLGGTHNNVRCYGQLLDEEGEVVSTGSNATAYSTYSHTCGNGYIFSSSEGCIADNWGEGEPTYEPITFDQAADDLSDFLLSSPASVESLVNDFTLDPEPSIDQAIESSGEISSLYEGPSQVSGSLEDGSQWSQGIQYDANGLYLAPPVVTTPQGDSYVDYSFEPTVPDSQASGQDVNVDIDLSGVEQRLDEIIENTEPEEIPELIPVSEPSQNARSFYESEYPDGFDGVWSERLIELNQTALFQFADQFKTNLGGGQIPSHEFCFDLGFADFGCDSLILDSRIWAAIQAFIIFTALMLARSLVFGG